MAKESHCKLHICSVFSFTCSFKKRLVKFLISSLQAFTLLLISPRNPPLLVDIVHDRLSVKGSYAGILPMITPNRATHCGTESVPPVPKVGSTIISTKPHLFLFHSFLFTIVPDFSLFLAHGILLSNNLSTAPPGTEGGGEGVI